MFVRLEEVISLDSRGCTAAETKTCSSIVTGEEEHDQNLAEDDK